MDIEQLQQLAMEMVDGDSIPRVLPEEVRKLIGDADRPMAAAHRLFAHIPDEGHPVFAPFEVAACRAAAAWFSGDRKAAEKVFNAAAWKKLNPQQRLRLYQQLLSHATHQSDAVVEEVSTWVLKRVPAHPFALKAKAVLSIRVGRPRAAVPLLEQALEANPEYASGWYNLACAWSLAGEKAPMLEALKKAIEHGKQTLTGDYREEAASDPDFERWEGDVDFLQLVRPMAEIPGAEELKSLYQGERFDTVLLKAASLMGENPQHAQTYATLARKATRAVLGDLDEHGDANAGDYGLGGDAEYEKLDAVLSRVEEGGGANAVKRFAALLDALKRGKPMAARKKPVEKPAAVRKVAKPSVAKRAAKPAAVRKVAKPSAAKRAAKPAAVRKVAKPSAAKRAAKRAPAKKGAKPKAVKKAAKPKGARPKAAKRR